MATSPLTVSQFAQRIKGKYPEYSDMDDADLTQRVLTQHPEYRDMVAPSTFGGLGPTTAKADTTLSWLGRQALSLLPAGGATAGSIAGSPSGPPGRIAGGAVGGGAGEALRQIIARIVYGEGSAPATSGEAALKIGEQAAMGAVSEAAPIAGKALAAPLRASAVRSMSKALDATRIPNKIISADVAPELVDRRFVAATREGFAEKAAAKVAKYGEEVDKALEALPADASIKAQPVLDALEAYKQQFIDQAASKPRRISMTGWHRNDIILDNPAVQQVGSLQKMIAQYGEDISKDSLLKVRRLFDTQVARAKGFQVPLAEGTALDAKKEVADAIRREFAKDYPSVATVNAEFSFWKKVSDVINATIERKTGQSVPLTVKLGQAAVGAVAGEEGVHGRYKSAAGLGAFALIAPRLFASTAWRTTSAVTKGAIADALASGLTQKAALLAGRLLQTGATAALNPREQKDKQMNDAINKAVQDTLAAQQKQ